MNSVLKITLGIMCLLVVVAFVFNVMVENTNLVDQQKPDEIIETTQPSNSQINSATKAYIVRAYNNNVAVFEEGSSEPYEVFDTDIRILPTIDQTRLEKGIRVTSEADLKHLLQDYIG